tara:strand:- start:68 stop:283 length:216 start_codon:yes stop_codon:yes gene_type:complete
MKNNDAFTKMTFSDYLLNLTRLDWFYGMSDDPRAYREGSQQVRAYRELGKTNGPEWVASFDKEQEKHRITS